MVLRRGSRPDRPGTAATRRRPADPRTPAGRRRRGAARNARKPSSDGRCSASRTTRPRSPAVRRGTPPPATAHPAGLPGTGPPDRRRSRRATRRGRGVHRAVALRAAAGVLRPTPGPTFTPARSGQGLLRHRDRPPARRARAAVPHRPDRQTPDGPGRRRHLGPTAHAARDTTTDPGRSSSATCGCTWTRIWTGRRPSGTPATRCVDSWNGSPRPILRHQSRPAAPRARRGVPALARRPDQPAHRRAAGHDHLPLGGHPAGPVCQRDRRLAVERRARPGPVRPRGHPEDPEDAASVHPRPRAGRVDDRCRRPARPLPARR